MSVTTPTMMPAVAVVALSAALAAILSDQSGAAPVGMRVVLTVLSVAGSQVATGAMNDWADRARDAIVQPTSGGGVGMMIEERARVVTECRPEMATFNCGSFNFGIFKARRRKKGVRPAADLLRENRETIIDKVTYWTGVQRPLVKALVEAIVSKVAELGLNAEVKVEKEHLTEVTVYATALAMNYLTRGKFSTE